MEVRPGDTRQARSEASEQSGLTYIRGLDGLRAIAVIAVMIYHANLPLYGGFLGVESFFVISGFLITSLLLADWEGHGRIRLRVFWWRRARRLLPALFGLLAGVAFLTAVLLPDERGRLSGDILAALAYVTNWHLLAGGQPYFDPLARPPLLQHLWSLAVEEQFYILWPLLVAAGMRYLGPRRLLALTILAAVGSATLIAALYEPGADPSRIYYGTDTRAAGLLLGAALAFVWAPGRAPALNKWPWAGRALDIVGALALSSLLAGYVLLDEGHPLLYRGGIGLVALATAALVAATAHPAARLLPRLLELPPLRWVGLRSYGLYLWHWPIFITLTPGGDLPAQGWQLQMLRFALTVALAALSYRLVELPIRRGALERAWVRWQRRPAGPVIMNATTSWGYLYRYWMPSAALLSLSLATSYMGVGVAQATVQQSLVAPPHPDYAAVPEQNTFAKAPPAMTDPPTLGSYSAQAIPTIRASRTAEERSQPSPSRTATASSTATAGPPAFDPALAQRLQSILNTTVADGFIPGATLSVRMPDGSSWAGASGIADRGAGAPMTPVTRVRIGSLSKMFTAVIVLQLAEEGRIALDDPVERWLPGLLPDGDTITVRMLLQHTSGLYDYLEDRRFVVEAYEMPRHRWEPQELVAYATQFPLRFTPGEAEAWDYSSTNFVVLGLLVEQVTGAPFADELDRRILTPLGLAQTAATPPDPIGGPQARGYTRGQRQVELSLSFAFATANIVTTIDDLRRFGDGLFGGELLGPESLEQMQRFVSGKGQYDMPELQYGLGLMANRLPVANPEQGYVLGHIGGINGFRSAIWYAPQSDIMIAISVNQGSTDPNTLATAVLDALLAAEGE